MTDFDPADYDPADPDSWPEEMHTARWYDQSVDPHWRGPEPSHDCEFLLGSHRPNWLYLSTGGRGRLSGRTARPAGPLFLSARQLRTGGGGTRPRVKPYPRADTPFCVDSGGFSELRAHGRWTVSPETYAADVRAWGEQTGTLRWAAIQDWMCEPSQLAKTGLSLASHQRRTIRSFETLRRIAPDVRWLPVLQGWTPDDYASHVRQYAARGHDLHAMELVGVGSVCRRNTSAEVANVCAVVRRIASLGLTRLHGFGVSLGALPAVAGHLASSDSLAWSYGARRRAELGDRNAIDTAERYRTRVQEIDGVEK